MHTKRQKSPPPLSAALSDPTDASGLDGAITVLVVDDEPLMIMVVCTMLLTLGYRAFTASNSEEAMRIITAPESPRINILLTDYWMSGMLGDELAKHFRKACPAAGIILMSGHFDELPRTPHSLILTKPFHAEALRDKLREALSIGRGLDT